MVARHPHLRAIVGGHLHMTMAAALGGLPVLAAPSVYLPTAPRLRRRSGADSTAGPGGFALHLLRDGELSLAVVR